MTPPYRTGGRKASRGAIERRFGLTLWTNDPELARTADRADIDRIGVDLERGDKAKRQEGLATWISPHTEDDLARVGAALARSELFARTNSLHPGTTDEIERLLDRGAQVLMLPHFEAVGEVEQYLRIVRGRARVVPLLETLTAAEQLDELVALDELDEIHVGINDLALELGLRNRLAVLVSPVLDEISHRITDAGLRLGVGGIARAQDGTLPVPSDLVYAQYPRLGSTAALISRSFGAAGLTPDRLLAEIIRARERMDYWFSRRREDLDRARVELETCLSRIESLP